ncbi:MAG: MTH1187 family thiamine-binding protein [Dehalococcoidales bacterium]|nr:MTH1187 family thiamine-binding protein [Dehalococcoidales bacterium]
MVVAEVSFEPIGTGSPSYSDIVTACVSVLNQQKDLKYDVTAMGTIIEGERDRVLKVVSDMEEACFKAGARRVVTNLKIDERRDIAMKSMQEMEREVEQRIAQTGFRY